MKDPRLDEIGFLLMAHLQSKYPASFGLLLDNQIARKFAEIEEYALLSHVESNAMIAAREKEVDNGSIQS